MNTKFFSLFIGENFCDFFFIFFVNTYRRYVNALWAILNKFQNSNQFLVTKWLFLSNSGIKWQVSGKKYFNYFLMIECISFLFGGKAFLSKSWGNTDYGRFPYIMYSIMALFGDRMTFYVMKKSCLCIKLPRVYTAQSNVFRTKNFIP